MVGIGKDVKHYIKNKGLIMPELLMNIINMLILAVMISFIAIIISMALYGIFILTEMRKK